MIHTGGRCRTACGLGTSLGHGNLLAEVWIRAARPLTRGSSMRRERESAQAATATKLGRLVQEVNPLLVDPVTKMPLGVSDRFGFDQERFLSRYDRIEQLLTMSKMPGAIARVSVLGLEPWYVWAHVVPPRVQRDPADPLDIKVPRRAIRRIGDWSLGLHVIGVIGQTVFKDMLAAGAPVEQSMTVWPIMLVLRDFIPYPLALDAEVRNEFVDACRPFEPIVPVAECFLEGIWHDVGLLIPRSLSRSIDHLPSALKEQSVALVPIVLMPTGAMPGRSCFDRGGLMGIPL